MLSYLRNEAFQESTSSWDSQARSRVLYSLKMFLPDGLYTEKIFLVVMKPPSTSLESRIKTKTETCLLGLLYTISEVLKVLIPEFKSIQGQHVLLVLLLAVLEPLEALRGQDEPVVLAFHHAHSTQVVDAHVAFPDHLNSQGKG